MMRRVERRGEERRGVFHECRDHTGFITPGLLCPWIGRSGPQLDKRSLLLTGGVICDLQLRSTVDPTFGVSGVSISIFCAVDCVGLHEVNLEKWFFKIFEN